MAEEQPKGFHLKKEINIAHILSSLTVVVTMACTALFWGSGIERRITVLETKQLNIQASMNKLEDYLIRIEKKVDAIR